MSYFRSRSEFSRIAIMLSLILHGIVFLIIAFVKIYNDEAIDGTTVSVAFVAEQKIRLLKRSLEVRPRASLKHSETPESQPTAQKVDTRINYRASSDFQVDSSPEVFSQIVGMGQETLQGQGVRKPSVNLRREMAKGMSIDLRNNPRPSQIRGISGGAQLISDDRIALARPEVLMPVDAGYILQDFLNTVREKIKSNKLYPSPARDIRMEGRSKVKMTILKDGSLESLAVIESSGYKILDNAALQSVRASAPFPPIPETAKRDRVELSIYLVFKISET